MDVNNFLTLFGTRTGRWLAQRLMLLGPGSEHLAGLLSAYAWNKRAADYCALPEGRRSYLRTCDTLRGEIESHPCWGQVSHRIKFW